MLLRNCLYSVYIAGISENVRGYNCRSFRCNGSFYKRRINIECVGIDFHPSHNMLLVVAINEKGVVMISPFNCSALIAICNAEVPLETYNMCGTCRYCFNRSSSSFTRGPLLVSHWRCHIPRM